MSDLISRQDALKPFCIAPDGTRIPEVDCDNLPVEICVEFIKKHLLSLPSAEPKTGKWIKVIDEETPNVVKWHYECDQCGAGRFEKGQQYCSRCGARMLGEDGEA